jgi:hypothetical protein
MGVVRGRFYCSTASPGRLFDTRAAHVIYAPADAAAAAVTAAVFLFSAAAASSAAAPATAKSAALCASCSRDLFATVAGQLFNAAFSGRTPRAAYRYSPRGNAATNAHGSPLKRCLAVCSPRAPFCCRPRRARAGFSSSGSINPAAAAAVAFSLTLIQYNNTANVVQQMIASAVGMWCLLLAALGCVLLRGQGFLEAAT